MQNTLEVRWFKEGDLPHELVDWLTSLGGEAEPMRTDLYLITEDPTLNIKLRERNVEVKLRVDDPIPVSFPKTVEGMQEHWTKWSSPLIGRETVEHSQYPEGVWLPVKKRRTRMRISPEEQSSFLTSHQSERAELRMEVTEIRVQGVKGWSLCVEASGQVGSLRTTIEESKDLISEEPIPLTLSTDSSFGYPKWLQSIVEG